MSPRARKTIKQRLERVVPGIGPIAIRTRARTLAEHRARIALFDRLLEAGQLDVVRMLIAKPKPEITWEELRQAQRKNRLQSDTLAADVALARPLWSAMTSTLPRMGQAQSSRDRYELAFKQLKARAIDYLAEAAVVKDLGAVPWPEAFASMDTLSPASRNRIRTALSAFLTVFLGDKFHPFRRQVVKQLGHDQELAAPKEITVEEFWTNVEATHEAVQPAVITLAGAGLRIGEFLQLTELAAKRLPLIPVTEGKTGASTRAIAAELLPYAKQAIPCNLAPRPTLWRGVQYDARYKRIYREMANAASKTGIPWSPHYLRHLYAQLGTDELPAHVVREGMGHRSSATTEHYARRRTTAAVSQVVGDALLRNQPKKRVGKRRGSPRRKAS